MTLCSFNIENKRGLGFSVLLILFFSILFISALRTSETLLDNFLWESENTLGEAGKVFYAHRFQKGKSIFLDGKYPPYYPSLHGALFHSIVGLLGRAFELNIDQLFTLGRSISLSCTLISIVVMSLILREFGLSRNWQFGAWLLFLASYAVTEHTTSYRPDNWNLLIFLWACYLLVRGHLSYKIILFLVALSIIAFFTKATGIILSISITLSLLIERRFMLAFLYCLFFIVSLSTICVVINKGSAGAYLSSFMNGMKVERTYSVLFYLLIHTELLIPLLLPIFYLRPTIYANRLQGSLLTVYVFWATTLIFDSLCLLRVGSWLYYMLKSYAFSVIIFTHSLHSISKEQILTGRFLPNRHCIIISMILLSVTYILYHRDILLPHSRTSYYEAFEQERNLVAEYINKKDLRCFSDDPNLNVRLKNPAVIYPILQVIFIRSGFLAQDSLTQPFVAKKYDIVVLSNVTRKYLNYQNLPDGFKEFVEKYYKENKLKFVKKYSILFPRNLE